MSYYAPPSDMALLSVKYFPQVIKNRHFKVPQNGKGRGESPESPVNLMQFKFRVVVSVVDHCSCVPFWIACTFLDFYLGKLQISQQSETKIGT